MATLEQYQAAFEVTYDGTKILIECGEDEAGELIQRRLAILSALKAKILELQHDRRLPKNPA